MDVPGRVQICMHFAGIGLQKIKNFVCCLHLAYNLMFLQAFFKNSNTKDINDEIWK